MSPHGLIPLPIKRARILVSSVLVTVTSVNFIIFLCNKSFAAKWVAVRAENFQFPDILRSAKSGMIFQIRNDLMEIVKEIVELKSCLRLFSTVQHHNVLSMKGFRDNF
jgi:hypothetical protein